MLTSLLTYLLQIINTQTKIIFFLLAQLANIYSSSKRPTPTPIDSLDYQKLTVDELPIIVEHETLDYRQLIQDHFQRTGKRLNPVKRRKDACAVPHSLHCPKCQAPHDYLYDNNGGRGQYQCKVCRTNFHHKNRFQKEVDLRCPHCEKSLEKIKQRKGFSIFKCKNPHCSYYMDRLNSLSKEELARFEQEPSAFKMHYLYRQFDLTLSELKQDPLIDTVVDLKKIHSSPKVLGLILTYHVNYGLSAEKTAALMYDVHQVKISGQTVRNYARSVASLVRPFTDYFPYELSDQFCGDETYIRVLGKWHYIYFFFDAKKKIILSHRYSPSRDTETAIRAFYDVLRRFDTIPDHLNLIVDGNPIYKLAQIFYAQHDIHFDVTQVIGLTNKDEVSKEYRPLKQIIERLNRTFKGNYKPLGGFGSDSGAIAQVVLFTTYFNFLRPHSSLEKGAVPVQLPELHQCADMPQKWIRLLQLAESFLLSQHKAA